MGVPDSRVYISHVHNERAYYISLYKAVDDKQTRAAHEHKIRLSLRDLTVGLRLAQT